MTPRAQPKIPSMTTTTFVRFIFLKDVRRMRLLLVLMLGLAVVLVLCAQPDRLGDVVPVGLLLEVLCLGVIVQLIVNDPAGRDFRFLFTRPVPGSAVLIAKASFLAIFMVVPTFVIHELFVARLGVPLLPLDHILMFLETAVFASYQISFFSLFCIFFCRNRRFITTAWFVGAIALSINMFILTPHRFALDLRGNETQRWLFDFSDLLFEFSTVVVVLITASIRYRTRRLWFPLGAVTVGLALSSLVFWWPLATTQTSYLSFSVKDPLTTEQTSRIHITLPEVTSAARGNQFILQGRDDYKILGRVVYVAGIDPPYFALVSGCRTVATFRSGKTFVYDSADSHGVPSPSSSIPDYSMANIVAGAAPKYPIESRMNAELLDYLPGSFQNGDLNGVQLQGTITVRICRAYRVGSVPLKEGQTLLTPRHRYNITSTYFSGDGVQFSFDSYFLPLVLRGELAGGGTWDNNLRYAVVYMPFSEALQPSAGGSSGSSNDFVNVKQGNATYHAPIPNQYWKPLPSNWASGAELVLVDSEPCGQITVPYEVDNVTLTR